MRPQEELLKLAKITIKSLDELKQFSKSSRELVKFNCEFCNTEHVSMITNLIDKKELVCQKCKLKKTLSDKYGAENYNNRDKSKQTCLERYGKENPLQVESIRQIVKDTNKQRYGSEWLVQSDYFVEKAKETNNKKFGTDYNYQNKEWIKKSLLTRQERYGDISFNRKYRYNETWFDSSWELAYYIWLTDTKQNFKFHPGALDKCYIESDGSEHLYYPDFLVNEEFQEIKGNQFFNEKGEPFSLYTKTFWWEKYNFLIEQGVRIIKFDEFKFILKYISKTYGSDYLKSFKSERSTTIP